MDKLLSSYDLKRLTPEPCRIISNDQLDHINTLKGLFGNTRIVYILYPWYPNGNVGHWCIVTKYNYRLSFFDSYGCMIDDHALEKIEFHLTRIFFRAPARYKVEFSSRPLQSLEDKSIATCGRYCLFWTLNYKKYENIDNFTKYIINQSKSLGMSTDQWITFTTELYKTSRNGWKYYHNK